MSSALIETSRRLSLVLCVSIIYFNRDDGIASKGLVSPPTTPVLTKAPYITEVPTWEHPVRR